MTARILHVSAVDFTADKLLRPQLEGLAAVGYRVRIACGRTEEIHWNQLAAFEPADIPFPRRLEPLAMIEASRRLGSLIRDWRPDLLHLHTPAASLPVRSVPHPSWPNSVRTAYTVHGYLHQWPPRGLTERLVQKAERWGSRRTDLTLFQSNEDLSEAASRDYSGPLRFLGNGVEDFWFDVTPPRRKDRLSVLFVGRLVREKGVLDLLQAVRGLPEVDLHIAGSALSTDRDGVTEEVHTIANSADCEGRVFLHGMLSRAELIELYEGCDVFCLPSYREGVPRSVIEGLAAARPVVATNIRGCRELVTDGENGYLVPTRRPDALQRAVSKLIEMDEADFVAMCLASRSSVDPGGRESQVFSRLIDAYQELGLGPHH